MTNVKVMRSKLRHYLLTDTDPADVWSQLNKGISSLSSNFNPEVEEEAYIGDDASTKYSTGLAVETTFDMNYDSADAANDYIFDIMWARSIGSAAETYMLTVDMLETTEVGTEPVVVWYDAIKDKVGIAFNSMGDEAVKPLKISVTLGHQGDPTFGWYEPISGVFSATEPA
jgi:hypothetical protein